mmetsp:Transcript_22543/g.52194  ORF Transcript_22543/g.52194 Transcript_22543/m.52194 type:complete len:222 (+) Transcript_22543:1812-2477(+)
MSRKTCVSFWKLPSRRTINGKSIVSRMSRSRTTRRRPSLCRNISLLSWHLSATAVLDLVVTAFQTVPYAPWPSTDTICSSWIPSPGLKFGLCAVRGDAATAPPLLLPLAWLLVACACASPSPSPQSRLHSSLLLSIDECTAAGVVIREAAAAIQRLICLAYPTASRTRAMRMILNSSVNISFPTIGVEASHDFKYIWLKKTSVRPFMIVVFIPTLVRSPLL